MDMSKHVHLIPLACFVARHVTATQGANSVTTLNGVGEFGKLVQAARHQTGLPLPEAAAWLGVGTRFLFDLERGKQALQMDLAIQVARKLGIQLRATPITFNSETSQQAADAQQALQVVPPANHPAPDSWLTLRYAASSIFLGVGLPANAIRVIRGANGERRLLQAPNLPGTTTLGAWLQGRDIGRPTTGSTKQENGGMGLAEIVALIRAHSESPLLDVQLIVRWFVLSFAIADTEIDANYLNLSRSATSHDAFRLRPFSQGLCFSDGIVGTRSRGMKVGGVWPETYLRQDHWKRVAEELAIHPKVVFQIMKEMAARVPGLLDRAILDYLGQPPTSRMVIEAIKEVRNRSIRLADVTLAARRNVSGLRTKMQPKVEALPTQLVIGQPKRIVTDSDDFE